MVYSTHVSGIVIAVALCTCILPSLPRSRFSIPPLHSKTLNLCVWILTSLQSKMSWQTYVDTNLVGTGFVSRGAIIGHDGSSWAKSPGFEVSSAEGQKIKQGFSDPSGLRASGIHVAGKKYLCLRTDDRSIYGKKGSAGICIVKTGQAILIGEYDENIQPGQCTTVVEKLADYLINSGY